MPNIVRVMNDEIRRLAKKEAKALIVGIKKDTIRLKKDNADLKRRIAQLERDNRRLDRLADKVESQAPSPEAPKRRLSSRNIKILRKKLKVSQAQFAKLVGVSDQSVYNWEAKGGVLSFNAGTLEKIVAVRGMSARGAKERLAKIEQAAKARAGKKSKKRAKKGGK
jgi:DNA-binding transcriptional regulator YiaG